MPLEIVDRGRDRDDHASPRTAVDALQRIDAMTLAVRPTLFAYQFVYELRPTIGPSVELRDADATRPVVEPLTAVRASRHRRILSAWPATWSPRRPTRARPR